MVRVQIDVGFGDAVRPTEITFPSLLDFPKSSLRADPRENSIAEKLDAMIQLSIANTGMKDCFDIWHLSRVFPFRGGELAETIRATFERRSSPLPASIPLGLSDEFARDPTKRLQWRDFLEESRSPQPDAGTAGTGGRGGSVSLALHFGGAARRSISIRLDAGRSVAAG